RPASSVANPPSVSFLRDIGRRLTRIGRTFDSKYCWPVWARAVGAGAQKPRVTAQPISAPRTVFRAGVFRIASIRSGIISPTQFGGSRRAPASVTHVREYTPGAALASANTGDIVRYSKACRQASYAAKPAGRGNPGCGAAVTAQGRFTLWMWTASGLSSSLNQRIVELFD